MKKLISKLFQKKKGYLPKYSFKELQESHLIDNRLKSIIQRANLGSIAAMHDLHKCFSEGKRAKRDLDMASYYLLAIINNLELKTDDDIKLMIAVLLEFALIEKEIGDLKNMNKAFYDLIFLMTNNLPMEEWDFSVFNIIKESIEKQ